MLTTPARGACCVLSDPEFDPTAVLAPFHPLGMTVAVCTVDPALPVGAASELLADLAPSCAVVPAPLLRPLSPAVSGTYAGDGHATDTKFHLRYDGGELLGLDVGIPVKVLATKFERAKIDVKLAQTLKPVRVDHTTSAVAVEAQLDARDFQYHLDVPDSSGAPTHVTPTHVTPTGKKVLFGTVRPRRLVQALAQHGIRHVSVSQQGDTDVITLHEHGARIELTGSRTVVKTTGSDASLRQSIRCTILSLLTEL
eukprot:m.447671 g.447671  ORF g.447671 m.447671 type:complete len:254 (-) comp21501_c2_seq4:402-1163(-)